jgi:YesN/AraC family two-component response regulator
VIRLLSVDDHPIVRDGIVRLIATQPDMKLIAEASDGQEAVEQFRKHQPDVTLMDLQMPNMNGIDAIGSIRGEFPEARIMVTPGFVGPLKKGPGPPIRLKLNRLSPHRS